MLSKSWVWEAGLTKNNGRQYVIQKRISGAGNRCYRSFEEERDLGTGRGIEKSVSFRGFGRMAGFCRCEGGHGIGVCVPTHLKAHANA